MIRLTGSRCAAKAGRSIARDQRGVAVDAVGQRVLHHLERELRAPRLHPVEDQPRGLDGGVEGLRAHVPRVRGIVGAGREGADVADRAARADRVGDREAVAGMVEVGLADRPARARRGCARCRSRRAPRRLRRRRARSRRGGRRRRPRPAGSRRRGSRRRGAPGRRRRGSSGETSSPWPPRRIIARTACVSRASRRAAAATLGSRFREVERGVEVAVMAMADGFGHPEGQGRPRGAPPPRVRRSRNIPASACRSPGRWSCSGRPGRCTSCSRPN